MITDIAKNDPKQISQALSAIESEKLSEILEGITPEQRDYILKILLEQKEN